MGTAFEAERSIITTYRKRIWGRFVRGVKEFSMANYGDKIAVCISGGKDSMLLAKCMQELQRHSLTKFDLEFICMDPGYAPANRAKIEENAQLLEIPVKIFTSDVFAVSEKLRADKPCYLCARMRRGFLYERAAELVADGVAVYADGQAYSADLKANELREIAKDMGLTFKVGTSKADMIAAMDAAKAEAVEDAAEDDLPELDLDEVVQ